MANLLLNILIFCISFPKKATQFAPSYRRAALLQVAAISVGFVSGVSLFVLQQDYKSLASGLLLLSVIPYTFIFMMPINRKLLSPENDMDSNETKVLLENWGSRHWVRTLIGLTSMALMELN
jgi:hypothetical protein